MSELNPGAPSAQIAEPEDPQTALPRDTKLPPFFSLRLATREFALPGFASKVGQGIIQADLSVGVHADTSTIKI